MGSVSSTLLRTIIIMKIILALFAFFVTAWCFPHPEPCFPFCNQPTNEQNCKGSQCIQSNGNGGGGSGGGFNFGNFNQQNCQGSQCSQNNRKKRESVQVRHGKTLFHF